jgi:hypothetical protein
MRSTNKLDNDLFVREAPVAGINQEAVSLFLDPSFSFRVVLTARPYSFTYNGRKVNNEVLTDSWLRHHGIIYDILDMRASDKLVYSAKEKCKRFSKYYDMFKNNGIVHLEDDIEVLRINKKKYGASVRCYLVVDGKLTKF